MQFPLQKGRVVQLGLISLSVIGLAFSIPMAGQEIRVNAARNALADLKAAGPNERAELYRAAEQIFSKPANLGEWNDLAAQFALLQQPMDLDGAEALTWAALQKSPARAESWARLAYIDLIRDGKFSPKALEYLERSFIVEPAGYRQFRDWRLNFMFSFWPQFPESLQDMTMRSLRMLAVHRGNEVAMHEVEAHNNAELTEQARIALQIPADQ